MSKRIDLTQFDAITKGDWELIDTPRGGIDIGVRQAGGHNPVVTFTQNMGAQVRNISRDVADMNAIAAVPRLIAELKRMYERETELLSALQVIKEYTNESQSMDNIKDYVNNACDTNLPYWGCACQGPHTGPC